MFLVFRSILVSPASCFTFFPVPPGLSAARSIWPDWQYITILLLALKNFEDLSAIFVHRLLGHLPNRNTDFPIFPAVLAIRDAHFSLSLLSWYLSISLAKFSKAKNFDFACLPSRPNGFLRSWTTTSFAAATAFSKSSRGAAELSPLLLDTQYHATRFANFLAVQRSFRDSPAIVFCLPRSGSVSLMLSKSWKTLLPPLIEYFRTYLRETSSNGQIGESPDKNRS